MMVDTFYYFDKSTKRKNGLSEYCTFCDVEFRQIIKHVSTRWLSLEAAVSRTLRQYPALRSYFVSECKCMEVGVLLCVISSLLQYLNRLVAGKVA